MMIEDDTLDSLQDYPEKKCQLYSKLDTKSKLLVILRLDSGQSESQVAKQYSVTPRTIGNIYKQREYLLQKYAQKHIFIQAQQIYIDQALLEWVLLETKCGKSITKKHLYLKAHDLLSIMNVVVSFDIDDWLLEFQNKHNIAEYIADIRCTLESKIMWKTFLSNFNSSDVYFGSIFALSHKLEIESYLNGQCCEDFVSIMVFANTSGTDKLQIAVIGKDTMISNAALKSLPVKYYPCKTEAPQVNYSILNDYLEHWDRVLNKVGKSILLVIDLPNNILHRCKFDNIKLIAARNIDYVIHFLEKLVECFKFNYRRLQISYGSKDSCLTKPLDYIHMFAMAWHTLSSRYIELLCSPQMDGFLYFDVNGDNYGDHSLSHWYKMKNIDLDQCSDLIDEYVYCDSKLESVNWGMEVHVSQTSLHAVNKTLDIPECSSLAAYQAMRRIVSYLHEQNAGTEIKIAKYLENHTEYGALTQMHAINNT